MNSTIFEEVARPRDSLMMTARRFSQVWILTYLLSGVAYWYMRADKPFEVAEAPSILFFFMLALSVLWHYVFYVKKQLAVSTILSLAMMTLEVVCALFFWLKSDWFTWALLTPRILWSVYLVIACAWLSYFNERKVISNGTCAENSQGKVVCVPRKDMVGSDNLDMPTRTYSDSLFQSNDI